MARIMRTRNPLILLLVLAALSACQTAAGDYPSLTIGDRGRVNRSFAAPVRPAPDLPETTPASAGDLAALVIEAEESHRAFQAEATGTRRIVDRARGASVDSDAWARAQIAVGSLESARSRTLVALAELDRIAVEAELEFRESPDIAAARDKVAGMADSESAVIDGMLAGLR